MRFLDQLLDKHNATANGLRGAFRGIGAAACRADGGVAEIGAASHQGTREASSDSEQQVGL